MPFPSHQGQLQVCTNRALLHPLGELGEPMGNWKEPAERASCGVRTETAWAQASVATSERVTLLISRQGRCSNRSVSMSGTWHRTSWTTCNQVLPSSLIRRIRNWPFASQVIPCIIADTSSQLALEWLYWAIGIVKELPSKLYSKQRKTYNCLIFHKLRVCQNYFTPDGAGEREPERTTCCRCGKVRIGGENNSSLPISCHSQFWSQ